MTNILENMLVKIVRRKYELMKWYDEMTDKESEGEGMNESRSLVKRKGGIISRPINQGTV